MSIKAYGGRRVTQADLHAGLSGLVDALRPGVRQYRVANLAERACREQWSVEQAMMSGSESLIESSDGKPLWRRAIERPDPCGWKTPVRLAVWADPTSDHWLVLIRAATSGLEEQASSALDAQEWAYWNNTDAPDNVADGEWQQRAASWSGIKLSSAPMSWQFPEWAEPRRADMLDDIAAQAFRFGGARLGLRDQTGALAMLQAPVRRPTPSRSRQLADLGRALDEVGPFPGMDGDWHQWVLDREAIIVRILGPWGEPG